MKTKLETKKYNQSGASLMLAVLVLAAVTAIAFSLATIVFIEIRSSSDASRTEPALYATFGVTEEALFQYKRFYTPAQEGDFDVPTCSGVKVAQTCSINGVTLTLPGTQPIAFDNSPRVEYISSGVTKTIPLYVADSFEQQYTTVKLDVFPNESSANVHFFFRVTQEDGSVSETSTDKISPGSTYEYNEFLPTGQYELILENQNEAQDLSIKIATERVDGLKPDGLPFVGEQVLRIVADYLGLTRTYQVRIPIP